MALPRDGTLYGGKLLPQNTQVDKWFFGRVAGAGIRGAVVWWGNSSRMARGGTAKNSVRSGCGQPFGFSRAGFEPFRGCCIAHEISKTQIFLNSSAKLDL
jgi:hypothetical protein